MSSISPKDSVGMPRKNNIDEAVRSKAAPRKPYTLLFNNTVEENRVPIYLKEPMWEKKFQKLEPSCQGHFSQMIQLQKRLLKREISQEDQEFKNLPSRSAGSSPLPLTLYKEDVLNGFGCDGLNPLMRAALMGSVEDVKFWLGLGADPKRQDLGGRIAWNWSFMRKATFQDNRELEGLLRVKQTFRPTRLPIEGLEKACEKAVKELSPALLAHYIGQIKRPDPSSIESGILNSVLRKHLSRSPLFAIHHWDSERNSSFQRGKRWLEISRVLLDKIINVDEDCLFDWVLGCSRQQDRLHDAFSIKVLELIHSKGIDINFIGEDGKTVLAKARELKVPNIFINKLREGYGAYG